MFKPVIFDILKRYNSKLFFSDFASGVIVAIVALPLAIAFAIASGVSPATGLITAVMGGFMISFFSGSRVQIGGPSGALIVVIYGIVSQYGVEGMIIASVLAGIMLVFMGLLKAGTVIQFMPHPIVVGFTSGIAIIIFTSQIQELAGIPGNGVPAEITDKWVYYFNNLQSINLSALGIGVLTIFITMLWPLVYRKIPGSLIAIVVSVLIVYFFNLDVSTIGSKFGELETTFRSPHLPEVSLGLIRKLLVPAFTIAMLISIESLFSAIVADGATGYRHRPNTELVSHGIANIVTPVFGGMAASGALAKTMTNVRNGGKTPMAGVFHALVLLMFLLFLGKLTNLIPLASLAGILVVVAYNMSEWRSFKNILKNPRSDIAVLLTTFFLTIFVGLNIALPFGIILALILFVKRVMETSDIKVLQHMSEDEMVSESDSIDSIEKPTGIEVFHIKGPFFFGIANKFEEVEKELREKPKVRILRFKRVPFIDSTGLKNLRSLIDRCYRHNIFVILSGVEPKVLESLRKDGIVNILTWDNICPDTKTAVARAKELIHFSELDQSSKKVKYSNNYPSDVTR